jgi:glutathione S-transferase
VWFNKLHDSNISSAIKRYNDEVNQVTDVLNGWLAKQKEEDPGGDRPWLLSDRISYADLAFISWQNSICKFVQGEQYNIENFRFVKDWLERMMAREGVKRALESQIITEQTVLRGGLNS